LKKVGAVAKLPLLKGRSCEAQLARGRDPEKRRRDS
jgi:hypothetical protein